MSGKRCLTLFIAGGWLLLSTALFSPASAVGAQDNSKDRPRIGLALSGGGARGAAHVGVLKGFEELHIPIDCIAGTSMGSIIGGLYAMGMTPAEIENALKTLDWENIFSDDPPREDRSFRRKRDDDLYLIKAKPGLGDDGKIKLPTGMIQGQKFDLALRQLSLPVSTVEDFDKLSIPFRAVASDIGTGESVVLAEGDIALAMRASMAVPGVFAATELDGHTLVDGGITNNLPISVVREMGADIVIAVDISTPLLKPEEVRNALAITEQLTSIMTRANTEQQIASLTGRDILLVPDLGKITSGDFTRVAETVQIGYSTALAEREKLAALALPAEEYRAHLAARARPQPAAPVVHFVRIINHSRVAEGMIRERIRQRPGEPLDTRQLEADIGSIYGLELFQTVRYDIVAEEGRTGIVITADERGWGPNYLQFGLAMNNNFRDNSFYTLGVSYLRTALNPLGGELRTNLQLGLNPLLSIDWHQPLDYTSRYFIAPKAYYQRHFVQVYDEAGNRQGEYRVSETGLELAAGREFDVYGEARFGYRWSAGETSLSIGPTGLPEYDFYSGSVFGQLWIDRLDNVNFPEHGYTARVEYEVFREALGNDTDLEQVTSHLMYFNTIATNTFGLGAQFNSTLAGEAAVHDRFLLGGFMNLSGYTQDSLSGQHSALLSAICYREFKQLKLLPWYIGASVEFGNVWDEQDQIAVDSAILSGSLFLGADTPLGPLYLGYGHADDGQGAAFMYLGKRF